MYADSPVWIADTLVSYLEETGDFAFLDQQVGFYDLATHRQDNTVTKSIYEHALTALEGLFRHRGQHGLCLIGHGDWNDALDGLSKRGQGVSTWLSMALIFASQRMLRLARHLRDTKTRGPARDHHRHHDQGRQRGRLGRRPLRVRVQRRRAR